MTSLFGYSLYKVLFVAGAIFLLLTIGTLLVGLIKARMDRNDPTKTEKEIQSMHNKVIITAAVFFSFSLVILGFGVVMYFRNRKPSYAPPPPPSPAATTDEQVIDDKLDEGWFLQPESSQNKNPDKDHCVIHKGNLAEWGLKHGDTAADTKNCDGAGWVLRKNTKTYTYNPERSRTVKYRGMRVVLNENIPGLGKKKTNSPAFYAEEL